MLVRRLPPLLAFLAPALSACQSRPAALTDADRNAIRAVVAKFDKAVLAADWPTAVSVYTEAGILMPPNGPVAQGRTETHFPLHPRPCSHRPPADSRTTVSLSTSTTVRKPAAHTALH